MPSSELGRDRPARLGDTGSPATGEHHALPAHEVVLLLDSDPQRGLAEDEAAHRRAAYGPNALPPAHRAGPLVRLARQLNNPLVLILLAAGAVTLVLGEHVDAAVVFGVVLVNAIIGYLQESRAEAALDALRSMTHTVARVVRAGHRREVPSEDLVPGDLVLIEAGDRVPADLRLVRHAGLAADESALTGESAPAAKDQDALPGPTPVADRRNMLYSGTLITSGTGSGVVAATGAGTELGQIHRLVGTAEILQTPLTRKIARFSKVLTAVILGLAALSFTVGLLRGEAPADMLTAAVALAVGAIPEGLPAAVTITLAIGVTRMARRRAVIRRLPAVETLGGTTVICTDKTGTLTENAMTVRTVATPDRTYEVTGTGYRPDGVIVGADPQDRALRWTLLAGAGCNDAAITEHDGRFDAVGDPTEAAMVVAAGKAGLRRADLPPRETTLPFDSRRSYMATLHGEAGASGTVLVKGATEHVLELCTSQLAADGTVQPIDRGAARGRAEELAARGLRVLATAIGDAGHGQDGLDLAAQLQRRDLVFTGVQAMHDPPRPTAADAVAACRSAGVDVKMITGDHAATAAAIATRLGLLDDGPDGGPENQPRAAGVLTGAELATLDEQAYPDAVDRAAVFARVSPEQKLRLVRTLQARGHVVAMTGDGVNDAPALRQADIGVAMGRSGTEVAKDAADMVLTDDDFGTIEAAVEEGRGVFDNLTKFIVWTLPTNMAEGLVILVAILLGIALPILPTQILWINMTTAVALGLMLAFEAKEPGIMRRPPRDPAKALLTGRLVVRIVLVSALLLVGTWVVFRWELDTGATLAGARTAAVNLFVAVEAVYLFSCRSLTPTRPRRGDGRFNRWIAGGVTVQVAAQLLLTYTAPMNTLFHTEPLDAATWARIATVTAITALVIAVDKRITGARIL